MADSLAGARDTKAQQMEAVNGSRVTQGALWESLFLLSARQEHPRAARRGGAALPKHLLK